MSEKTQVSVLEAVALLGKGYTLADLAGITPEQLDVLYAVAYQYYVAKNYKDALSIFRALCLYDAGEQKYFMGLAGCQQGLKKYNEAADSYSMCCVLSGLKDPKPMYYAAVCLLKADRRDDAVVALRSLEIMGRDGKYKEQDDAFIAKGRDLYEILTKENPEKGGKDD